MRPVLILACLLTLLFSASGFERAERKTTLLVAEYDMKVSQNFLQHLYAFQFMDGKFVSKEKIVSVPYKKEGVTGNYIRFDIGQSQIYKNRYVITGMGNVIDIVQKKVLLDKKDKFVKGKGDSLIFYTNDIFKGRYYSLLNLKTGEYSEIRDLLFKAIDGQEIEVDQSSRQFKIWLYPVGKDKVLLVNDAGYGEDAAARKEKGVQVPVYWLDNNTFIYPNYSQQKYLCTINKVDVVTKTQESIGSIGDIPSVPFNSYFYKDSQGTLVYVCGKGNFAIDLKKKKLAQVQIEELGNGFTADLTEIPGKGRSFNFQGSPIGNHFCDHRRSRTGTEMLAVPFDLVINGERYPQGVTIWDNATKKWKEIDVMDVAAVVGFVEN